LHILPYDYHVKLVQGSFSNYLPFDYSEGSCDSRGGKEVKTGVRFMEWDQNVNHQGKRETYHLPVLQSCFWVSVVCSEGYGAVTPVGETSDFSVFIVHRMKQLLDNNLHCLILTSGTLSPLPSLMSELGISIPVTLENPHVIGAGQVFVSVVSTGPDGYALNSSYNMRYATCSCFCNACILQLYTSVINRWTYHQGKHISLSTVVIFFSSLPPNATTRSYELSWFPPWLWR